MSDILTVHLSYRVEELEAEKVKAYEYIGKLEDKLELYEAREKTSKTINKWLSGNG